MLSSFTIKEDCTILKNNSFTYKAGSKEVLVVFGENEYVEYHEEKRYHIKSLSQNEMYLDNVKYHRVSKLLP